MSSVEMGDSNLLKSEFSAQSPEGASAVSELFCTPLPQPSAPAGTELHDSESNILQLENHRRICNPPEETERFKGPSQAVMGNREPDFMCKLERTLLPARHPLR
ncbi:hypothetical protein AV530_016249 [Patagioenas fasciata monilis]|uniref:Uncharacterized protein n=1 Tax=Patagioenas fasciata monilis TaxID=372326 RepID=A0A1V4JWS5_PATFA|nr:hypothetical protein AV530_016249 [Patagioenas fasciata monilis]